MPIRPEMKARYPADWKLRRRFVLMRAGNKCEWCGAENGRPHPITGSKVVLTTAHVFDHRPEAASLLNLAALCQRCHLRHDARLHAETRRTKSGRGGAGSLGWPRPFNV
jgi:5-methylcytosine-specific restriction endonuclease McrA